MVIGYIGVIGLLRKKLDGLDWSGVDNDINLPTLQFTFEDFSAMNHPGPEPSLWPGCN